MKILVIASAREHRVLKALYFIGKNYPESEISILAFNKNKNSCNSKHIFLDTINKQFNIFDDFKNVKNIFKDKRFDNLIVVLRNNDGFEYFHIELLAYFIKFKKREYFDVEDNFKEISIFNVLKRESFLLIDKVWFLLLSPVFYVLRLF